MYVDRLTEGGMSDVAHDAALQERAIDTIRFLCADAVEQARSGHPGMPMGAAAMAYTLWTRHLKHSPQHPAWPDRDRFVLSAGHGSMLLYALLHLSGYEVTLDDIRHFRQLGSITAGHPEYGLTPGVETTTGPLGQGLATAVGMAIAEAHLAARYDCGEHRPVDHFTYVIAGDGDLMEGVTAEAASLAGHLGLGRLIVLYDDNHVSIDGPTDLAFSEDVAARFVSYGWHTQRVADGNDVAAVDAALTAAKSITDRPSFLCVRTHIGYGAPHRQDTAKAHGEPLGTEELRAAKVALRWPAEPPFLVPDDVLRHMRKAVERGAAAYDEWQRRLSQWAAQEPALAKEWYRIWRRALPGDWDSALPSFPPSSTGMATRSAGGRVINALAGRLPELIGGSADLTPSTKTFIDGAGVFSRDDRAGRNVHFGVREHAMAAACNGIALHGGLRPFAATFFVFSDYMRPALRLAALTKAPVVHVLTHDSIGLGEDGPTHQPVEHLAMLRSTPGWLDLRPADANETAVAWRIALRHDAGPVALVLSRQELPVIDRERYASARGLERGGYVLADWSWDAAESGERSVRRAPGALPEPGLLPEIILIASGSEVHLVLGAYERLRAQGVRARVVALGSWAVFAGQSTAYREGVLPAAVRGRLAVEAGSTFGWERWVGLDGDVLGLDGFGASAAGEVLLAHFGFTVDNVCRRAEAVLVKHAG